jgi:hypothetical protein
MLVLLFEFSHFTSVIRVFMLINHRARLSYGVGPFEKWVTSGGFKFRTLLGVHVSWRLYLEVFIYRWLTLKIELRRISLVAFQVIRAYLAKFQGLTCVHLPLSLRTDGRPIDSRIPLFVQLCLPDSLTLFKSILGYRRLHIVHLSRTVLVRTALSFYLRRFIIAINRDHSVN